jgi:hypothetical protein
MGSGKSTELVHLGSLLRDTHAVVGLDLPNTVARIELPSQKLARQLPDRDTRSTSSFSEGSDQILFDFDLEASLAKIRLELDRLILEGVGIVGRIVAVPELGRFFVAQELIRDRVNVSFPHGSAPGFQYTPVGLEPVQGSYGVQ